jgi:hypothetical protein
MPVTSTETFGALTSGAWTIASTGEQLSITEQETP